MKAWWDIASTVFVFVMLSVWLGMGFWNLFLWATK